LLGFAKAVAHNLNKNFRLQISQAQLHHAANFSSI